MNFKAAIFDFDGTVTKKGIYAPSQKMADALVNLAKKIPIAFCTGRQLESFEKRGLGHLLKEIKLGERNRFLQNLFLFAENGAVGYFFDTKKGNFSQFYRVDWPENFIKKFKLKRILTEAIKDYGSIYENAHRVVIVMRTKLHDQEDRSIEEVYQLSEEIFKITVKTLKKINPKYEKFLHVGNSGIGVIVGPANGDKDIGIRKFAEYLQQKCQLKFGQKLREILVVGDSPQKGGNDFYFLKGTYGTPFTVGDFDKKLKFPKPVLNQKGQPLLHETGTLKLINSLL